MCFSTDAFKKGEKTTTIKKICMAGTVGNAFGKTELTSVLACLQEVVAICPSALDQFPSPDGASSLPACVLAKK